MQCLSTYPVLGAGIQMARNESRLCPHGARCQFRTQRSKWAMSLYIWRHAVTGASQGTLGAGLGTQDWFLCAGAPGLEL